MANTKIPSELSSTPSISDGGNATAITIDSSENVGIGNTSPATWAGDLLQTGSKSLYGQLDVNGAAYVANNVAYDGTNWKYITTDTGSLYAQDPSGENDHVWYTVASGTAGTNATLNERMRITDAGKVGINTSTVPHGSVGHAMFAMDGANNDTDGPHVQYTTASDNYPIFQQLNWGHDNISFNFDMYYDGSWRSSDAGSNYQIYKYSDQLQFWADDGITAGGTLAQEKIAFFDTSGRWQIPKQPHVQGSVTNSSNSNAQANTFAAGTYNRGTLSVNVVSNQARFTAPVNGLYLILFKTIMGTDTSRRDATILVNGSVISQSLNDVASGYHYRQMAEVLALSANDYVTFGAENWYDNTGTGYTVWRTASMTLLG